MTPQRPPNPAPGGSDAHRPCAVHARPHRLIQPPLADLTERLRQGDRKVTGPRQAMLDVLRRHASPLTIREIHAALDGTGCDVATVYRNMHTLEEMGVVKRFDFGDGAARFELLEAETDHHHHHLVCRGCGMVVEVDGCFPAELEQSLADRHGFTGISHRLEFFGTCPRCRAARGNPA